MTTNLTEVANFDPVVYEIQTDDPVLGGPGGIANVQAQALADRTQYLLAQLTAAQEQISAVQAQVQANLYQLGYLL
jgi:hypothetical protein